MVKRKNTFKLAASLICGNYLSLQEDISSLIRGKIDYIHFDVMDGVFVPRYGLFPEIITQMRQQTAIPIDMHMMVSNPEAYIKTFVDAGANQKDDIYVVHAESTVHLDRIIRRIHDHGIKAGVALNPATPLEILKYVLNDIDLIMLMAINPGIVGHKLIPHMLNKIKDVKQMVGNRDILIEVDGGVNFESAPQMIKNGANMLVCGTQTIYRPHEAPIDKKIKELRKLLDAS